MPILTLIRNTKWNISKNFKTLTDKRGTEDNFKRMEVYKHMEAVIFTSHITVQERFTQHLYWMKSFKVGHFTSSPSSAYVVLSCTDKASGSLVWLLPVAMLWAVKSSDLCVWASSFRVKSLFNSYAHQGTKQKSIKQV